MLTEQPGNSTDIFPSQVFKSLALLTCQRRPKSRVGAQGCQSICECISCLLLLLSYPCFKLALTIEGLAMVHPQAPDTCIS